LFGLRAWPLVVQFSVSLRAILLHFRAILMFELRALTRDSCNSAILKGSILHARGPEELRNRRFAVSHYAGDSRAL